MLGGIIAGVAFAVFMTIYIAWAEHDKRKRKQQGMPRRKYGCGIVDADISNITITHKVGDTYYSTTFKEED